MRSHPRSATMTVLVVLASLGALLTAAAPAQANQQICDRYGTTTIQDRYVVQNNRWGTSATQCINVTGNGFEITQADGSVPTNGAPKSYPSVYDGCHYGNCAPRTTLPMRISSIGSAPSSVSYRYTGNGVYNAAYDIWLDPTPRTNGVNRTEIMIWFNRVGPVQPIGSPVGTAHVGGRSWEVWTGSNGSNDVISFLAPSAISSWSFDVKDFVDQAVSHGLATPDWYLTSIQAGFEPWEGGTGLAVNSFSSAVNAGGGNGGTPGTPAACQVSYSTHTWPGGFTVDTTITNTGSTPVDGWELDFTLPAGHTVTSVWNALISPASGAVTARSTGSNGRIAANGGTQSFGFQGTSSGAGFTAPAGARLNGTSCTVR
uniref:Cellulase 12A n=2 Tax=Streptomyces sp. 11AG8 TaxID=133452 RepID=Q9KIH1_9ACTN|nr:cellulase 12A [Streptomyces sp. 11AG8]